MELHLVRILTTLINQYTQQQAASKDLVISETCVETYFELLLKQLWYKEGRFGELEDVPFDAQINENYILQMFKTLSQSTLKYSDDHLLILF